MPIEIGLQTSQEDSFKHHEELSKLLTETDVFYVPIRHDLTETNLNANSTDLSELTKRFDEDLSNRHLIVTFRDIGYSLFLDSVQRFPDENDRSKVRVSGKMVVDGICIQFLGCFDCRPPTQQISGVGRVELDENYYRELSSNYVSSERSKEENLSVPPVIMSKTSRKSHKKPVTRSQTINENLLTKTRTSSSVSPPKSSISSISTETIVPSVNDYPRLISHYSSTSTSIPIAIPSSNSNSTLTNFIPFNHSQSLPAYVVPANHIAYLANPSSSDLNSFNSNLFFITNPHHQPVHILTPIDYRSIPLTTSTFRPCNILPSKRPDQDANPSTSTTTTTINPNEQLPFKKRRYTGETNRTDETK